MGMTLALRLTQKGESVTIFESAPLMGGLAGSMEIDGIVWDRFYHVILMSDLHTRKIIKELGLEDEFRWVETKTGFFADGNLYSMSNIMEFLRFPPINLIDKVRLGLTIISASLIKDLKKMEDVPVEVWLKKWSGRRVYEKIWLPLLRAKLGDHYKETSASFILSTIQRMYAARRTGLKKEMFGYVSGGYKKINTAFDARLRSLGVEIRLNTRVRAISSDDKNSLRIEMDNGAFYRFDKVISTLPSDLSASLVPSLSAEDRVKLRGIKYLGVICPSLLLARPISKYYVTNIIDSWTPFTGIIEMTAIIDPQEVGNHNLVYLPKYLSEDDELFKKAEREVKEYFLDALFRMYPELSGKDILKWNYASAARVFALPTLNYSENLPSVKTSLEGYYIINSAHITSGTLNVNETIQVAENKLDYILNE